MKIEFFSVITQDQCKNYNSFYLFPLLAIFFLYSAFLSMHFFEAIRARLHENGLNFICVYIHLALNLSRFEDSRFGPVSGMTADWSEQFFVPVWFKHLHGKKRRARCSTGLNNVFLPTLFTLVNNIEQYCWAWIGCNNIVQYCWQLQYLFICSGLASSLGQAVIIFVSHDAAWLIKIIYNTRAAIEGEIWERGNWGQIETSEIVKKSVT